MITFSCECGKRHQVKDELAGKRAKCSCGKTLVIPQPSVVADKENAVCAAMSQSGDSDRPFVEKVSASLASSIITAEVQPAADTADGSPMSAEDVPSPESQYWYSYGKRSVAETAFGCLCAAVGLACIMVVFLPLFMLGRITVNIFTVLVLLMGLSMLIAGVPRIITGRSGF
jgi:hypothetical protein